MKAILVTTKKKGRGFGELLEQEKSTIIPKMTVLWG